MTEKKKKKVPFWHQNKIPAGKVSQAVTKTAG